MPGSVRLTIPLHPSGGTKHKRRRSRISPTTPGWANRMRRRLRHNAQSTSTQQSNQYEAVIGKSSPQEVADRITAQESAETLVGPAASVGGSKKDEGQDVKPWETLIVGANLGYNLSRVEYKDREILQQGYIVNWYEKHQPSAAQHQSTVLADLVKERAKMKDTHRNTTPIEELRNERAIADRLVILRNALESSRCDDESVNIRAAISGYESGQITCSEQFTLIYGGRIVDTCPSYNSFCEDRDERLDRYEQQYGSGWLWHEPPLAASHDNGGHTGIEIHAKKGFCLYQSSHTYEDFGLWPIFMRCATNENKVRRKSARTAKSTTQGRKRKRKCDDVQQNENGTSLKSCTFKVALDTGATFPVLLPQDLLRLGINTNTHAAQGAISVSTTNGRIQMRFYELYVGMGSAVVSGTEFGSDSTNETGWPLEKGVMGGLCPVFVNGDEDEDEDDEHPDQLWQKRLSGLMPFKACYVSSVPAAGRIWMGENRRDVLGSQRMPPYRRFSTHHVVDPGFPSDMHEVQDALGTPDSVTFFHRLTREDEEKGGFIERESQNNTTFWSEVRGDKVLRRNHFGPKQAKKTPKLNGTSWRTAPDV
ncbi:hypothetical protein PG990_012832 [Apiospora arundinis]